MRKVERITIICGHCDKSFSIYPVELARNRKYCSRQCKSNSQKGLPAWNKGLPRTWKNITHHSDESRKKIGLGSKGRWSGDKNPNWHGGIDKSKERNLEMHKLEYVLWRKAVYARDYWTCVSCGYKGKDIEADHIKPWSLFPDLRYDVANGRTLCKNCHQKTDTWGMKVFTYKERMVI